MTITLKIEAGNDAMLDGQDVAELLRKVAADFQLWGNLETLHPHRQNLLDRNGNTVGPLAVRSDRPVRSRLVPGEARALHVRPGPHLRQREGLTMRTRLTSYVRWRDPRDDARPDPSAAVAVTTLSCAGCGQPIIEVVRRNGTRSYDQVGICSGVGQVWHRGCPCTDRQRRWAVTRRRYRPLTQAEWDAVLEAINARLAGAIPTATRRRPRTTAPPAGWSRRA